MRTTTGGIGREPGMLIEILVVSVVSVVLGSGSASTGCGANGSSAPKPLPRPGIPYGGVPDG
ncbi:hypothetical protein C7C46_26120 [Streptomyces tateyamensis]|uniref:Uncharacterized protein n=1 Tax=Streptomyces tateyamensis TaxID=565073 RepID=A0A2V4NJQ8_9ACTN|nr:hypothetical protein C7C46_26120 [Streptomyces tateyamensis]